MAASGSMSTLLRVSLRHSATPTTTRLLPDCSVRATTHQVQVASAIRRYASTQPQSGQGNIGAKSAKGEKPLADLPKSFDIDTTSSLILAEDEKGQQTTGARARSDRTASQERARRRMTRLITLAGVGLTGFWISNLGREFDTVEERNKFADNPKAGSFMGRIQLRLADMYTSAKAPVWEKALPDPLPFPYQRPYTLVLDIDDLLIHSEWSRQHAWRTAKRPGLDYFLGYLSQFYEIVLFSRQPMYVVAPVVEKLDPDMRVITYALYRESCRLLDDGTIVKDLSHLNRDLSKVIAIDTDPEALKLQPENAIILKPWKGEARDTDLIGLLAFLEAVGIYGISDVRQTLKAYEGTHIPTEHAKRQKAIKEREAEEWRQKHENAKGSILGFLRGATVKSSEMPKTWYELEQERFRQGYQEDQKYWKDNAEQFRQQAKEEQEKKLKEMKLSAWGLLTGGAMQQPQGSSGAQDAAPLPPLEAKL